MNIPDDPLIQELLPEFIETWIQDFDDQFGKYVKEKNYTDLYRLAHTLKGSCFQFGLDEIANMGIEIMGYCKTEDWDKIATFEQPIKNGFLEVKVFLDNQ